MPWADVTANVRLPLDLAGVPRAEAEARIRSALAQVELSSAGKGLAAPALGRHAHARLDRPRAGHQSRPAC